MKFGLIPEFVGRVPVIVTLKALDEQALINILTQPKNALTKQFKRLFEMDGVELDFEPDALKEIAKLALERNTGARGLRAIVESLLMDSMYEVPSSQNVTKCVVTKETVRGAKKPELIETKEALPAANE